ncbi:MAG: VWA domain-containing protein [Chloroflexi bacterium]|nr:VWA domain-containing protein [Chloroflexota bacterium]
MLYRYSRWDGTQHIDAFTADELMDSVADHILGDGDLRSALQRMVQRGATMPNGRRFQGLQDLLERLRGARQRQLQRYNLGSVLDDIRERLEHVLETERAELEGRMEPGGADEGHVPQELRDMAKRLAEQHRNQLDQLPEDTAGKLQGLRDYEFLSQDARQQFQDLLAMLQQQVLQQYFRGLQQGLQSLTPEALQDIRDMVRDLNELLEGRGSFDDFMQKWGRFFPPGLQNEQQLRDYMQNQMAAMQNLLDSMSPDMRSELEQLLQSVLGDQALQQELARLAGNLGPPQTGGGFPFGGDEPLTLQQAMRLMDDMHGLDELERELLEAVKDNDVSELDTDEIGRLIDGEAKALAEQLQDMTRTLEEAGLIKRKGKDWELTPRAIRKIGERALQDIFGKIDPSLLGNHDLQLRGSGPERLDETKRYAFGDAFNLDANRTVMNALLRPRDAHLASDAGEGQFVKLQPEDFEVSRSTVTTRCSTVIMLDMSYSMMMGGRFEAGRRVALALDSLIRSKFPRDTLHVVAFSYFVLTLQPHMLLDSYWVEYGGGTNFQEALRQARMLLGQQKSATRQIVMITDGQPNTYSYWSGRADRGGAMAETMREIVRCTRDGIVINTFMLAQEPGLTAFVRTMAKVNRGRAFFASPRQLGAYVLLDYLGNKRKAARS